MSLHTDVEYLPCRIACKWAGGANSRWGLGRWAPGPGCLVVNRLKRKLTRPGAGRGPTGGHFGSVKVT